MLFGFLVNVIIIFGRVIYCVVVASQLNVRLQTLPGL